MINDDRGQFSSYHAPGLVLISVTILGVLASEVGLKITFVTFVLASLVWVVTGRGLARRHDGGDES
jgi:hypothetical protein